MTQEEFVAIQRDGERNALSSLIIQCVGRFLIAARLVSLGGPTILRIRDANHNGRKDQSPLFPTLQLICDRSRLERFDPQVAHFRDHREEDLKRQGKFPYWKLYPTLLRKDEVVSIVLRVVILFLCHDMKQADSAIRHQNSELHFPTEMPRWDTVEID